MGKIGTNESAIESNLEKIGSNESAIASNLTKIGDNETNIASNLTKIGDNETNILSNKTKIDDFIKSEDHYILKDICLLELYFQEELKLDRNRQILEYEKIIDNKFEKDDYLQLNESIYYSFSNAKSHVHLVKEYLIKDENDNIIYDFYYNVSSRGTIAQS